MDEHRNKKCPTCNVLIPLNEYNDHAYCHTIQEEEIENQNLDIIPAENKKKKLTKSVIKINNNLSISIVNLSKENPNFSRAKITKSKCKEIKNKEKNEDKHYFPSNLKTINQDGKKMTRKNSSDIDREQIKRYFTKKKTQYFQELNNLNNVKEERIEEIKDFKSDCILYDKNNKTYIGKLFIDQSYTFYFSGEMNNIPQYFNSDYYVFPLLSILKCVTNTNYFGQSNFCKEITLKDYRNFIFKFTPNSFKEFTELIDKFALPEKSINYFNYAYYYKNLYYSENKSKFKENISIYNFKNEFLRQGIDFSSDNNKEFNILDNSNFKFCETYPKKLIMPYGINDEELKNSASFRTKERIPTLTYRYKKNGNCIWRSSQTKTGFSSINKSDVLLLTKIANKQKLCIYDARPFLNAYANKLKGAGYENINNYPNIDMDIIFCGMTNIHSVRNSYQKIMSNVSYNTIEERTLFFNITNSGWYEAIIILLKSSFQIYNSIREKNNILIHCSDGWDRTSQLCATSQILLDKYYRTLDGFICLIEKDWLSFGHQFRYRSGFYSPFDSPSNVSNENQFSPIFLQWLDAIYQLMNQNYNKFQFNFNLILLLAEEIFSGKYGTFLFNNDKEREEYNEKKKTLSIWNYIKDNEEKFINKIYNPDDDRGLIVNCKKIKIWRDYFYRFERGNNENYLEEYDKKLKGYENNINKDKNIIEQLSTFIANKCEIEDLEGLDKECKKIIEKLIKEKKEKEKKNENITSNNENKKY